MKNPTMQELMEYVDGTLQPLRYQEVEKLISTSPKLQNEILLLKSMRTAVQNDALVFPSKKFTSHVMKEIIPTQQESFWFQLVKNSSNMFAMVLVLSMIGIVLALGPAGTKNNSNLITKSIESYSSTYNSVVESFSHWTKPYAQPIDHIAKSSSGKFLYLGLAAFFIFMIVDGVLNKKYFHARIKH